MIELDVQPAVDPLDLVEAMRHELLPEAAALGIAFVQPGGLGQHVRTDLRMLGGKACQRRIGLEGGNLRPGRRQFLLRLQDVLLQPLDRLAEFLVRLFAFRRGGGLAIGGQRLLLQRHALFKLRHAGLRLEIVGQPANQLVQPGQL